MKKIMFLTLLAFVVTVPAWAAINITATTTQVEVNAQMVDTDEIVISYENTEPNHVRAFAFDVVVAPKDDENDPNCDPKIVDINELDLNVDYWVYPGSIDINEAGEVNDVGTPVGDPCQLPSDTQGGLGTAGITVEMGSLYVGSENAPATSGVLLKIIVDDNCKVTMTDNVSRGAVVLEGVGSKAQGNYTGTSNNMYTHTDVNEWRRVGSPKCWCRFKGGRQCHGDADSAPYGKNNYYVSIQDNAIIAAAWQKPYSDMIDGNGDPCTINVGGKDVPWICADFDHLPYGKNAYRVSIDELTIRNNNWQLTDLPAPTCP